MGFRTGRMPDFYGIFTRVHLTDARIRRAAGAIRLVSARPCHRGTTPRSVARTRRARVNWRRALPVGVAATAALGVAAGVTISAFTDPSGISGDSGRTSAISISGDSISGDSISGDGISGDTARSVAGISSVAALPRVQPVTGNASVVGYAPASSFALETKTVVPAVRVPPHAPVVAPLKRTRVADLMVVAPFTLSPTVLAAVAGVKNVSAVEPVEAVRVKVNGTFTAVLGVDPSGFRGFAAQATAASDNLWRGVAGGGIAVSYTMGKLDHLPLGGAVTLAGKHDQKLRVVAFGTLGIGGVNAVVSHNVARSLGAPVNNAIVISLRGTDVSGAASAVAKLIPQGAGVQQLVTVVHTGGSGAQTAGAGTAGAGPATAGAASTPQINVMLAAAMSRQGKPYVWGGNGPDVFDCSGLVKWSFAQAGIVMPRVAADQALAGPAVPVSQLQAGDLLFYHTDATAPNYISHVAIYMGNGWMIQAPEPGKNVEVVPADLGSEFAGAVRVSPAQAASVAAHVA
jgi:peptidoglycan DL-endopeptidase CwlO